MQISWLMKKCLVHYFLHTITLLYRHTTAQVCAFLIWVLMLMWNFKWKWSTVYRAFINIQTHSLFAHFIMLLKFVINQYPILTKQKQNFRHFCKFIKREKLIYYIGISIQTLFNDTWNVSQVPPISHDHLWAASTPWLESICGKLNWLDMIWKGTHLSK